MRVMVTLESVPLFRNLTPAEMQDLRAIAREQRFTAGARVFGEGDPGDCVYIVGDGLVEISGLVGEGVRRVFSQLGAGEIFGEMAVVEQRPRSATATALKETGVYCIQRDEMLVLLQRSPTLAFNVLQEISHRLREFNKRYLREVVEAERLAVLGTFARSIVHDLKTPLTIITLSAETVSLPTALPEKRAQAQERISNQIRRINNMIGDIVEFTRGRQDAALVPGSYPEFIWEMLPELQTEAETRSAHISLQNEPPPVRIAFDARRLRRVFSNLVRNATEAMADAGEIYLRFQTAERDVVTEIEDTGPGIDAEVADRLFQPFATYGKSQGTGLGLAICKKIIEDHKGRIWVRSEPGRGAIFCFTLPLAK